VRYGFGVFQQAVGKGAFAMVNMGNDTEIANVLHIKLRGAKVGISPRNSHGKPAFSGVYLHHYHLQPKVIRKPRMIPPGEIMDYKDK
jgi:hypothetical protein